MRRNRQNHPDRSQDLLALTLIVRARVEEVLKRTILVELETQAWTQAQARTIAQDQHFSSQPSHQPEWEA